MRIRLPVAGTFFGFSLIACYFGFSEININDKFNDKLLHFIAFFILTTNFYWILDTTRRRVVNLTLLAMFLFGGVGSECVQGMLPYRAFDPYDILANLLGCSAGLGLCTWYHKRQLERKRHARGLSGDIGYEVVDGDERRDEELGIIHEVEEDEMVREMGRANGEDEEGDIGGATNGKTKVGEL